jgi:hypothetical protein
MGNLYRSGTVVCSFRWTGQGRILELGYRLIGSALLPDHLLLGRALPVFTTTCFYRFDVIRYRTMFCSEEQFDLNGAA